MGPGNADRLLAKLGPENDKQLWNTDKVAATSPEWSASTFTYEGPAWASKEVSLGGITRDRLGRGAILTSGRGYSPFVQSIGEMLYTNYTEVPEEVKGKVGDEYWGNFTDPYKEVLAKNGFGPDTFKGLAAKDAEEKFRGAAEMIRINDRVAAAYEQSALLANTAGFLAFGTNLITDPLNLLIIAGSAGTLAGARALSKASIRSLIRKQGAGGLVREIETKTAETLSRKLATKTMDVAMAASRNDSILAASLGIQNKIVAQTMVGTTAGALGISQDLMSQLTEYENLTSWDMAEGEFEYNWMRGGLSFLLSVGASQLFAGGQASWWRKDNAAFAPFGVDSLAQARLRSQVLNDPTLAHEIIDAKQILGMEMLQRIEGQVIPKADQHSLPWRQDPLYFDKIKEAGWDLTPDDVVNYMMKLPTRKELDNFLNNFDPSKSSASASVSAKITEKNWGVIDLEQKRTEAKILSNKIKTSATTAHEMKIQGFNKSLDNARRKLKRREESLASTIKSRRYTETADLASARQQLSKAEAEVSRLKQNIVDAGNRRGQAPRDVRGDPQMQMPGAAKQEAEVLAGMRAKVKAAEETAEVARSLVRDMGMKARAETKARLETEISSLKQEIDTVSANKAKTVKEGPLANPDAIQRSNMIRLKKIENEIQSMVKKNEKIAKELETLKAKRDTEEVKTIDMETEFSRASHALSSIVKLRKAQAEGVRITDDMITDVVRAFENMLPSDARKLKEAGLDLDSMDLSLAGLRKIEKVSLHSLDEIRTKFMDQGFKAEGVNASTFIANFDNYWRGVEHLTPHNRNQAQKVALLDDLINQDFIRNLSFLTTGDVEKYLRQNLVKKLGLLTQLGTRGAQFARLERLVSNKGTPVQDLFAINYVMDIFAHAGSARQRPSAINPNKKWVGGMFHQFGRAESKLSRAMEDYIDAIGLNRVTGNSISPDNIKIHETAMQLRSGAIKAVADTDPRAIAGAKVLGQLMDDLGTIGLKNGALRSLIDNYLDIQIHPGVATPHVMALVSDRIHASYKKEFLREDAELHSGTVAWLDWATWKEKDGQVQLIPTTEGSRVLNLSTEKMDVDLDAVRFSDLSPEAKKSYIDAINNEKGALTFESKRAAERRIRGKDLPRRVFNTFGIYEDAIGDTVLYIRRADANRMRKIEQSVWYDPDIMATGLVETNMFTFFGNMLGKTYKIYRQDFVNDYYGRADFDFDSMIGHANLVAKSASSETERTLQIAIKQITEIDEQFSRSMRYLHEEDLAEAVYAIRNIISAGVNMNTAPLVVGVEGGGSIARAMFDGNFFHALNQVAAYTAQSPEHSKRMTSMIGQGINEMNRTGHVMVGTSADRLSRSGVTGKDKFLSVYKTLRDKTNKKPTGGSYSKFTRASAALNEAARLVGLEDHLSRANRVATVEHEWWLFKKHARKIDDLVETMKVADPQTGKEFKAALRKSGWGTNEAYARQILSSGLGEPDARNVLRQLPDEAFEDLGSLNVHLSRLGLHSEAALTDRLYVMWRESVDTWNPANNPMAGPSSNNPVHSFFMMFTTHANNFFQNTMQNVGNRRNGEALALMMTYASTEYMAYISRQIAYGQITPEQVRQKIEEDPIGVWSDALARSAILGPWLGGMIGAVGDSVVDSGINENKFADALPTSIGLDMFHSNVNNMTKAMSGVFGGEINPHDITNGIPVFNKQLNLLSRSIFEERDEYLAGQRRH